MNLSIVIPVYNEEENLPILVEELNKVLSPIIKSWEIIFINDGSTDKSLEVMKNLKKQFKNSMPIKIINLDKNYGLSTALAAGLHFACGEIICTMDADLQNDPKDIPNLLSLLPGYDAVVGWRKDRCDPIIKKLTSYLSNTLRELILNNKIHDSACTLKVFRQEYVSKIKIFNGFHRFLPALLQIEGAKIVETKVHHRHRIRGKSKYGLINRLGVILDVLAVKWMQKRAIHYKAEVIENDH